MFAKEKHKFVGTLIMKKRVIITLGLLHYILSSYSFKYTFSLLKAGKKQGSILTALRVP